jgi:tetratricopeptide (TPR) repeat protein
MHEADQVLWTLDNVISPAQFERLCVDLLGREGYSHIVPIGGTKDHGRDAELKFWEGESATCSSIIFQFSLEQRWEAKLKRDAAKIATHCTNVRALVYVTSRKVTGVREDALVREFLSQHGWQLTIYSREWLRHRLTEMHHDLASSYLGVLPQPTPGFAAVQFQRCELDDHATAEIFRHTSPELLRATLAGRAQKEPLVVEHWFELARVEFLLRNYEGAMHSLARAFSLSPTDQLLVLNMTLFKAALLAESGLQRHSRPLLIQARDILLKAMPGRKRAIDHYNLANIQGALGEVDEARKQYAQSLVLDPKHAQSWKNLGSLLVQDGKCDAGIECFDYALSCRADLVEAHLSKATALLIFLNRPSDAITCFEAALNLVRVNDLRWPYIGYWFSKALSAVGRDQEALTQVDEELSVRPDDIYLLNQKAAVLIKLRRIDRSYEESALELFRFRAHALPRDFLGLSHLIEILAEHGKEDDAWPLIAVNLPCEPFSLRDVAQQAAISINDLALGFQHAELYGTFRTQASLEDHCVMLHNYGLFPDARLVAALDYALMAPFGIAARELASVRENHTLALEAVFELTLNSMCRVFPTFGSFWLSRSEPRDPNEKARLLSLGICYLLDVVVSETARQIGFLKARFMPSDNSIIGGDRRQWREPRAAVGVALFDRVAEQWQLGSDEIAC